MREILNRLSEDIRGLVVQAGKTAERSGIRAYLVGGFLRDLILGVENFDLDIAVEGDGIGFAEALAKGLQGKLVRHRRFGTATIILSWGVKLDIATARREVYPRPGELPVVTPGSIRDDLFRRDFTINALAVSITGSDFGKVIDLYGAKEDIRKKRVRVLHDLSFLDDPTRILRAIRFEQRFAFRIEPRSLKLAQEACRKKMLERVEPQRLRDEIILMLKERRPLLEIRRMKKLVGFAFISPDLRVNAGSYALFRSVEASLRWFDREMCHRRRLDNWIIYLMALTQSLDERATAAFCRKFAFGRGETIRLISYKHHHRAIAEKLSVRKITPAKIFSILEPLSYELLVMLRAQYRNRLIRGRIEEFLKVYNGTKIHTRGCDLKKLGVLPGPEYKKIFDQVLFAKLNGKTPTKEDELELICRLLNKK